MIIKLARTELSEKKKKKRKKKERKFKRNLLHQTRFAIKDFGINKNSFVGRKEKKIQ